MSAALRDTLAISYWCAGCTGFGMAVAGYLLAMSSMIESTAIGAAVLSIIFNRATAKVFPFS